MSSLSEPHDETDQPRATQWQASAESVERQGKKRTLDEAISGEQNDDPEVRLIEALWGNCYKEQVLNSGCLMYTLLDETIPWLYQQEGEPLIVRPSTREVYDKLRDYRGKKTNVLITGNPGIGKTWFHNYFLLRHLPTMKDDDILVLEKADQKGLPIKVKKGEPAIRMTAEETLRVLTSPKVTYLVDTGGKKDNEASRCLGWTILTSSPAEQHYKSFMASRNTPVTFYYAPWTLDELLAAKPKEMDDAKVTERFYFVGGIPRHVFATEQGYARHNRMVEGAIKQINWGNPDSWMTGNQLELAHPVFVHQPRNGYTDFITDFVSEGMGQKVFDHFKELDDCTVKRFLATTRGEALFGGIWGFIYENYFFSHLTELSKKKAKPFCLQLKCLQKPPNSGYITDGSTSRGVDVEVIETKELKLKIADVISAWNIKDQIDKHVGSSKVIALHPRKRNHPTVDGLILDGATIYGIQVAKAGSHGIAEKGLSDLRSFNKKLTQKSGGTPINLIMVHPPDVKFSLEGNAWNVLKDYPEVKVYEADWEPPMLKPDESLSSANADLELCAYGKKGRCGWLYLIPLTCTLSCFAQPLVT